MQTRGIHEQRRADAMPHGERLAVLQQIHEAWGGDGIMDDTERVFPSPPPAAFTLSPVRARVWEARWPSAFEPYLRDVRDTYLSRVENRTAHARLFLHEDAAKPRPVVVGLHGYMAGQWFIEENAWPIDWLLRRGLDVALLVLPMHASRRGTRRGPPGFPSSDPKITIEGFRQAVFDVRTLVRWLRQRGAPTVGVMGMSLGGYTSALVATVTNEVDFVMPMIPLASIADFAREQGRLGSGPQADEQHAALDRVHRLVSPLARPLQVPERRALVVAAEFDRITPSTHASRLAAHFGCSMVTIRGAHLVQLGRSDGFRAFGKMLESEGIIPPRPANHGAG